MRSPEMDSSPQLGLHSNGIAAGTTTSAPTSGPSKQPRWGSIRQRFSGIQSRDAVSSAVPIDSVDDGMWDKNDAAFLEEVARSSPLVDHAPQRFDKLTPREARSARRSSTSNRPSTHRSDFDPSLQRSHTHTKSSSSSLHSSSGVSTPNHPSSQDDLIATSKIWSRNVRRRSSAAGLPDLPEQARSESIAFSATSSPINDVASVPLHFESPGAPSNSSSFRSSPSTASSVNGAPDKSEIRPTAPFAADLRSTSPSFQSLSTFHMPGFTFRQTEDGLAEFEGRFRSTERRPSRPSNTVNGLSGAVRSSSPSSRPASPDSTTSHSSACDHRFPPSDVPHDGSYVRRDSASSPYLLRYQDGSLTIGSRAATGRRPSIASILGSPQPIERSTNTPKLDDAPFSRAFPTPMSEITSPNLDSQSNSKEHNPPKHANNTSTVPAQHLRKHTKNKSSLVAGLRKLMGRREKDQHKAAQDGTPLSPTLGAPSSSFAADAPTTSEFRVPASSHDAEKPQANVSYSAPSDPAGIGPGGLNLLGLPPSSSTPAAMSDANSLGPAPTFVPDSKSTRRTASMDLLRSFAGGPSRTTSSDAATTMSSVTGRSATASSRARTKSTDGLTTFREAISQRMRTSSNASLLTNPSHHQIGTIEHISFDEARRLTGNTGPMLLNSKESLEELRSFPSPLPGDFDKTSLDSAVAAGLKSPIRPSRRPSSSQSQRRGPFDRDGQSGVHSSTSSSFSTNGAAADPELAMRTPFGFQPQPYKPFSRESIFAAKGLQHKSPPSSPLSLTFQLPEHRSSSQESSSRGHIGRRSLNSLGGAAASSSSSKPWSSFLSSPILSSSTSASSHNKRLSAMTISRPLSVSSSAFSHHSADIASDMEDLTLTQANFGGVKAHVDSNNWNSSEPNVNSLYHPSQHLHLQLQQQQQHLHHHQDRLNNLGAAQPSSLQPLPSTYYTPSSASAFASTGLVHPFPSVSPDNASAANSIAAATAFAGHLPRSVPQQQVAPTGTEGSATRSNRRVHSQSGTARRPMTSGSITPNYSSPYLSSNSFLQTDPAALSTATGSYHLNRSSSFKAFKPTPSSSATATRPPGARHRPSSSASSLSGHRKRPSFGLNIEPEAHSAFDSIPSPLLRSRHLSSTHDSVSIERPLSTSSSTKTPPASNSSHSTGASLSIVTNGEEQAEVEMLRDPSRTSRSSGSGNLPFQPALGLQGFGGISQRYSASVPQDEGDSPRQYQEESWDRAVSGKAAEKQSAQRQYMIHSPNEEEGPAIAAPAASTSESGRLSQATKDIAFGSIAGMVSKVFEHPFDLVKVRLQTQSADRPARYSGAFDCFKQTYLKEGIRGLYRGLSMPVVGATLENACLFFTYNQIQSAIRWFDGQASAASAAKADAERPLSIPQLAIAAAGAGAVTSVVLTPIELIKCKMQVQMITKEHSLVGSSPLSATQPAHATNVSSMAAQQTRFASSATATPSFKGLDGPLTLLRRTIATDGLRGLWLGQTGTLLRETGGGMAWFLAFESCSRYMIAQKKAALNRSDITKKDLSSLQLVGAGALAGISYNVVLFPADSVKSTMQTEQEMRGAIAGGGKLGEKFKGTGFFETFKKIYRTRGIKGLYAGCGVTCLRSAPSSAIIFLMYNKLEAFADSHGL